MTQVQDRSVTEVRTTTNDVLKNHLKCFGEGDLEGILSDYAPGAVLFTADGPLRGKDAIRSLFTAMLAEFAKPGAAFSLRQQFVDGDYAFVLWTAETADNLYEFATDTFFVRDGKIAVQSFAAKTTHRITSPAPSHPDSPSASG
jgi:ketosteroid isomerase-like protein